MLIALHLGAHKTASTYVQQALEQSQTALNGVGVGYLTLAKVRSRLTRRLDFAGFGLGRATRRLLEEHRDYERLILSDENILGGLRPARRTRSFYSSRGRRLALLVQMLRPHEMRIFFATRSYGDFISAMYCEYIRHNPFITSETYLARVDILAFSWIEVIATFVRLIGAESVTLWSYEDFQEVEDEVFQALTGGRGGLVEKPGRKLRESLSVEAVQMLGEQPPTLTRDEIRSRSKRISAALPKGPGRPGFTAFSASEAEGLRARYEEEMRLLSSRFPGITMLAADPSKHAP